MKWRVCVFVESENHCQFQCIYNLNEQDHYISFECEFIFVLNKHQLMIISFNPPCAVPDECVQQINALWLCK